MTLSDWIQEVRIALIRNDMNVYKLADKVGVSPQWIYQTLRGQTNQEMVNRISEALGINSYEVTK